MVITSKIIITDTNIITDLDRSGILQEFVMLDNVYISDMVLNDEVNWKTGNVEVIKKFKVMEVSAEQLILSQSLFLGEKKLSLQDILNYVIAKENNCILATGDNRLKEYAEINGVEVIRTLKIIKLMKENHVISVTKGINACRKLIDCSTTRIPKHYILDLMNEFEVELICN